MSGGTRMNRGSHTITKKCLSCEETMEIHIDDPELALDPSDPLMLRAVVECPRCLDCQLMPEWDIAIKDLV